METAISNTKTGRTELPNNSASFNHTEVSITVSSTKVDYRTGMPIERHFKDGVVIHQTDKAIYVKFTSFLIGQIGTFEMSPSMVINQTAWIPKSLLTGSYVYENVHGVFSEFKPKNAWASKKIWDSIA